MALWERVLDVSDVTREDLWIQSDLKWSDVDLCGKINFLYVFHLNPAFNERN